ncbi:MAG: histidine kinase [Sphingomonas sp.]
MWRYVAGGVSALLLVMAGIIIFKSHANAPSPIAARPSLGAASQVAALPDAVPEASDRTREQKRFDRYDKDRNGAVTREEYLAQRRKAYAKLDVNHDGMLSFDEWAVKAETKFAGADRDKSGTMTAAEFATTAVKRKARIGCPKPAAAPLADDDG